MKKWLCIVLAVLMLFQMISVVPADAATKVAAPAYNGKWTYYAIDNTIYKLDSQSGVVKKVKQIKSAFEIMNISYYNKYLYFTVNYYIGTDGANCYVCRMKLNGSGYEKLARGNKPVIYGNKIYYMSLKHIKEEGQEYDDIIGIGSMSLAGREKKLLIKNNKKNNISWNLEVEAGKIFYVQSFDTSKKMCLMEYGIKSADKKKIFSYSGWMQIVSAEGDYVYLQMENNPEYVAGIYEIKTNKLYKKSLESQASVIGGKNGMIYYSSYETNSTYAYFAKENKTTTVIENKRISEITFSKSGYQVVNVSLTQEEFEASGYRYDMAVARMKLNGKGFKILKKYYIS